MLVKVNGQEEYFDPGAAFTPFGMLPWMETAVAGLKLDRDGGSWIQTDMPTSAEARLERVAKAAEYTLKVESKNGVLRIQRMLRSDLLMVDKQHYPALRSFYQLVKTGDEEQVVLQPADVGSAN